MNKELLLKVNDWVQAETKKGKLSEWNQQTWACKTACCFAGKVVLEAGGQFVFNVNDSTPNYIYNGVQRSIQNTAQEILGLDTTSRDTLFAVFMDASEINNYVQTLVNL